MSNEESKRIMARNIQKCMDMKGVTNQQLCDDLNIKYTTFMDWKKAITYPRIGKIEAMANYFGVLKSDLIEDKGEEHMKKLRDINELDNITSWIESKSELFEILKIMYKAPEDKQTLFINMSATIAATVEK